MFFFSHPLIKLQKSCLKALENKKLPKELRAFYERPMPTPQSLLSDFKITSIDFETTGLNFNEDVVLSMGGISFVKNSIFSIFPSSQPFFRDIRLDTVPE